MAIVRVWQSGDNSDPRDGSWDNAAQALSGIYSHDTEPWQYGDTVLVASDYYKDYGTSVTTWLRVYSQIISVNRGTEVFETGATDAVYAGSARITYRVNSPINYGYTSFEGLNIGYTEDGTCYFPVIYTNTKVRGDYCFLLVGNYMGINSTPYCKQFSYHNCVIDFGDKTGTLIYNSDSVGAIFNNCSFNNISSKSYMIDVTSTNGHIKYCFQNCDFSSLNFTFFDPTRYAIPADIKFQHCKLHSSFNIDAEHNLARGDRMTFEYCSNTGVTATPLGIYAGKDYFGTSKYDTTVYRYGTDGENSFGVKLATNTNASLPSPLKTFKSLSKWHRANNLSTLNLYFVSDDTDLTDRNVWIHVHYNSHTSEPVGTFISTLAGYGNQTGADSSSYLKSATLGQWTGTGFNAAYRVEVTGIQPQEPGPISVDFYLAKPSTTVWLCPYMEIS